jgi:hypothetical protein
LKVDEKFPVRLESALGGLDLEEFGDGLLRIAFNDQSLVLGAGFSLWASSLAFCSSNAIMNKILGWGENGAPAGDWTRTPGMGTRLQTAPVCQFQHWGTL